MNEPMTPAVARPSLVQGLVRDAAALVRSRRNSRALAAVIAVALAAIIAFGYLMTRTPTTHLLAFYPTGRATLTINDGKANVLPLASEGATLASSGSAGLTWESADGWYLNLNGPFGFGAEAPASQPAAPVDANGSFQLNGADFGRWAGIDSKACAIIYSEVAATRIAGSISCRGLLWYDKSSVEHVQPVDVPAFDLDVTFEATGDGKPPANPS